MKSILIVVNIFLFVTISIAQIEELAINYRVTAYKVGAPQVVSQSNEAITYPNLQLYIPNAFTPNGDGLNEQFGAVGEGVGEYHLTIYDRWGQKLFESYQMNNTWDGKYKGELVEIGTYAYSLEAKGIKTGYYFKSGTFNLVM